MSKNVLRHQRTLRPHGVCRDAGFHCEVALAAILWNARRDSIRALSVTKKYLGKFANCSHIAIMEAGEEPRPSYVVVENSSWGLAKVELSLALERLQFVETLVHCCQADADKQPHTEERV